MTAYTAILGLPLLAAPNSVIPWLGFAPSDGPWVRLAGMFLLVISYLSAAIYRERAVSLVPHSIVVRVFIVAVLLWLALTGQPPFLFVPAAIVGIGVAGSTHSYLAECRPSHAFAQPTVSKDAFNSPQP